MNQNMAVFLIGMPHLSFPNEVNHVNRQLVNAFILFDDVCFSKHIGERMLIKLKQFIQDRMVIDSILLRLARFDFDR